MPILSIVVPIYNKSKYLSECIQSILNQTVVNFELLLINDGSTDDSGEKCDKFCEKDSRIRVIHQKNQGVSSARNAGLKIAKGKYIGFVDSDDVLHPNMYERLISNIENVNADISICGVKRITPRKTTLFGGKGDVETFDKAQGLSNLFCGKILLSNYDKIYKKDLLEGIFFKPALFEDTYFNFEALARARLTVYDPEPLYNYILRDNSHSLSPFNFKYMNALRLAYEITTICENELPEHANDSKAFHFNTLMMVLNMLLVESDPKNAKDYTYIRRNLSLYNGLYLKSNIVLKRYKLGYLLFRSSPTLYILFLKAYSRLTNSEHIVRKKNKS